MKKVLFVTRPLCEPWDEASKNFAYDLARNISEYEITILTCGTIENLPHNIKTEKIYSASSFGLIAKAQLLFYLLRHAKDFGIVHYLFTPTKLTSFLLRKFVPGRFRTIQTAATVRDDLYSTDDFKKIFFADAIVTYAAHAKKSLEDAGIKNVTHIYPGLDFGKFSPKPKNADLLARFGFSHNDIIVTYPGEFVRLGATDTVLNAFIELWGEPAFENVKYVCACRVKNAADAKKKNRMIERLKKTGFLDRVVFTGTYSDMNALFNLSDIVLFPVANLNGKFDVPLAMIEPYACKKPVIASDLQALAEFSSEEINAIIPRNDERALAHAIAELTADVSRRNALGENAHAFVHKTFNIQKSALAYTKLYDRL